MSHSHFVRAVCAALAEKAQYLNMVETRHPCTANHGPQKKSEIEENTECETILEEDAEY